MNKCVPCWDKQKLYEWKHVAEVFGVASLPHCSSRTAEGNADQTLKCAARERWAKQREEALCASYTLLQKKNEELKDVLWGWVISRSSRGSPGVSTVTRYAYSTGSAGVCKFLFLSHIWSCFLRLCLLFRSLSRSGGGNLRRLAAAWLRVMRPGEEEEDGITPDSFLSWEFSTQEAELESVEDGDG